MLLGGFYYATKCYRYSEMPLVFASFLKVFHYFIHFSSKSLNFNNFASLSEEL